MPVTLPQVAITCRDEIFHEPTPAMPVELPEEAVAVLVAGGHGLFPEIGISFFNISITSSRLFFISILYS